MAVELATAFVSIVPETKRVGPEVRRAFRQADTEAQQAGRRHGDQYSQGFGSRIRGAAAGFVVVDAAVRTTARSITAAATSFVRNAGLIAAGVRIAARVTQGFSRSLMASTFLLQRMAGVGLGRLVTALRLIGAVAERVARQVTRITSALLVLATAARVVGTLNRIGKAMAAITMGSAIAVSAVAALATSLSGPLVAAASAAGAAIAAVAGAAAGILAPAIASLRMGFSGLAEGAKAYNKVFSTAPTQSTAKPIDTSSEIKAVERANRNLVSSEKAVEKAKESVRDAEKDLEQARKDATDQIEDMNRSLKNAALSEKDAQLSLLEARRDLANEEFEDPLDRERALLRVAEAEQRLLDVQHDNRELREETDAANRAGVEGSEQVAQAQERLKDAHEGVAEAEQGVVDAHEAIAEAQDSLNKKLNESSTDVGEALSPDEAFYQQIGQRLAPVLDAYRSLKLAIIDEFSQALGPAFEMMGGFIGKLQPKLVTLTGVFGAMGNEIARSLTGPAATAAFESMTDSSTQFFSALAVGENGLGGFTTGLAQYAATAASVVSGSGAGLNDLLLDLGQRIGSVSADSIRSTFENIGQVFSNIAQVVGPVINVFRELGPIASQGLAPGFIAVGQAIRDATPGLIQMAEVLMPALGEVMERLAPILPILFDAFMPWAEILAVIAPVLASVITELAPMAPLIAGLAIGFKVVTAALTLYNAAMLLVGARSVIATVATRAFNLALRANPIGLIVTAIGLLAAGLTYFFTQTDLGKRVWAAAWDGIKNAFAATMDFLRPAWDWILGALQWIGDKMVWLWQNVMVPAWTGAKAAFSVFWGYAQTAFTAFKVALGLVGTAIEWVWKNIFVVAFKAIAVVINAWWIGVQVIFNIFKLAINAIGDVVSWLWKTAIQPAFEAIGSLIKWVWENVIKPVFDSFVNGLTRIGDWFQMIWDTKIRPAWAAMGEGIEWVIDEVVQPAFEALKTGLQRVWDFFKDVVNGIKNAWDGIRSAVAKPVNFIIESVWNNGLVKAWNTVSDWLPGLKEATPLIPVAFAKGGSVSGGKAGKDSVPALLMPKEHVWDVDSVESAGGQDVMYAMRNLIKRGIPFSWDTVTGLSNAAPDVVSAISSAPPNADMAGLLRGIVPGFRDGGEVKPAWMYQLENGHRAAKMRDGNPYTWGHEDCSGYMSMIADAIINGGNGVRRWATSSFPGGQPWVRGLGEGFSVGVHDNPGGPGGGHTAGTLTGVGTYGTVNVESGGSHGRVAYGGPAAGADSPQWDGKSPGRFHLEIGADGAFVSGGVGGGSYSGPSPDEQKSFLTKKLEDVIERFIAPVRALTPKPPPEMLGVPDRALTATRDMAVKVGVATITGLGSGLRSVFEGAGDSITSVFRDTGGFIGNGLTLVRNETGKPEAVLNWQQLEEVRKLMTEGKSFLDAVREVNVSEPSGEDIKGASAELGPNTTSEKLFSTGYGQRMASVTAKTTKEFMGEAGKIIGEGLWEMINPFPDFDPVAIADRYTIESDESKEESSKSSKKKDDEDDEIKPYDTSLPETTDLSVSPIAEAENQPEAPVDGSLNKSNNVSNIAKAAKDAGLDIKGAIIGVATGITESNLRVLANQAVPDSFNFPNEGEGSDHDSIGIMQQRPSWGPVATLMSVVGASGLFFDKLKTFDWQSMDPGAAAQKVQVSAHPGRYSKHMAEAEELLKGKFDSGGIIPPGLSIIDNQTRRYEPAMVFNPQQWETLSSLANNNSGGNVDQRLVIENLTVQDWREAQRELRNLGTRQQMRYAGRPKA